MKSKKSVLLCLCGLLLISFKSNAQIPDSKSRNLWSQSLDLNFYIYRNGLSILPIYSADKKHLHLEGHYNYEAANTFSLWYGYNFIGNGELSYVITPIAGVVFGQINGLSPGLNLSLNYKKFGFTSDTQYVFDLEDKNQDYLYNWSELTYSANEWIWFGASYQRTRLFEEKAYFQAGPFIGGEYRWLELDVYLFFGQNNPFGLVSLTINYE